MSSIDEAIAEQVGRIVRQELEHFAAPATIQREALTVPELAESLGMSTSWVYDAIKHHGLPARRVGKNGQLLISVTRLREWLDAENAA